MLTHLDIRNIVLIDHLVMEMSRGFSVLTGETGAGKSILLDALGLLRGDRSDPALIRKGADSAAVQAAFEVPSAHPVRALLADQGIGVEGDAPLLLRRTLSMDGKSRAFINDQMVTITFLKTVGTALMDIHGQFDTSQIFDSGHHRDLVDQFGALEQSVRGVADLWAKAEDARAALRAAEDNQARALRDEDYLRASLSDLEKLNPRVGEEQDLARRKQMRAARAQVAEGLSSAFDLIEGEGGADMQVAQAARIIDRLRDKLPEGVAASWLASMDAALEALRGSAAEMESFARRDPEDEALSDEQVEDRLYELRAAARRYGCAVDNLPDQMGSLRAQMDALDRGGAQLAELARAASQAEDGYMKEAAALSAARAAAARALDKMVNAELAPLKLDRARFETVIDILPPDKYGPMGMDRVRFTGTMNVGTAAGPLDKIASGGELSRLMLALKVALFTRAPSAVCLIFDEVDSGLGGAVAAAVAERLARLSRVAQVLAVTHAPQVAARAGHHFVVSKGTRAGVTLTAVKKLGAAADRREEIARMLSGAKITDEARAAAEKLLEQRAA